MAKQLTQEEVIKRCIDIFDGDISIIDKYVNAHTRIRAMCNVCDFKWYFLPYSLFSRRTMNYCSKCTGVKLGNNILWTREEEELLLQNYTLLNSSELSSLLNRSEGSIRTKLHRLGKSKNIRKKFNVGNLPYSLEETQKLIGGEDLKVLEYKNGKSPIKLQCTLCSSVWSISIASNVIQKRYGYFCKDCNPQLLNVGQISKAEVEILQYIRSIYSEWIITKDRLNIPPLELDIVIPDLGIAIEYNGNYWHSEIYKDSSYHLMKTTRLKEEIGYNLIHINSDEWLHKQAIVKSRLLSILGKSKRIFARNTKIQEIPFPKEFLETNHIQGVGSPTSINLGLFHNEIMVAVMTFSKPRFNNNNDYELVRYCSLLNTTIVGGASKLLSYFNNNYIGSIISYSDKRWSSGNLYKKLGFKYSHTSPPNYRYHKSEHSLSRYQCQKHLLKDRFPQYYREELSETEIMIAAGYYKVYDCGNDVWIYE